jgi:hypothetical protein
MSLRIYTSLDAYLDTRLGIIAQNTRVGFEQVFLDNRQRYWDRDHNRFWEWSSEFSQSDYLYWYQGRNKDTLKLSLATNFTKALVVLHERIRRHHQGTEKQVHLVINVAPYTLDQEEKDVLMKVIHHLTDSRFEITLTDVPMALLTPGYLKDAYNFAYLPDFDDWWRNHSHRVYQEPMGDFLMFVPTDYIAPADKIKEITTLVEKDNQLSELQKSYLTDPQYTLHATLMGYMHLMFYPLKDISILDTET